MEGMEVVVMEVEGNNDGDDVEERESEEVRMEEIMPRMMLRVLLVEADDSTRQIVGALLQKCNYKVAAISDGLKAWEFLKRHHNNIDLVLTELDLPSISGYALLTLIMEQDSCKDIPVIIMSSQDSVNMVLKCILKGAADFLIKPVRKNELKNLWRHVWKRIDNNAGHNSQNLTAEQYKAEATNENNLAINRSEDNVSSSYKSSRSSEKSTDSHGLSWMKHREEAELCREKEKVKYKNVKVEEGVSFHTRMIRDDGISPSIDCEKIDESRFEVQPSKEVNVSTVLRVEVDGSNTEVSTEDGRREGPGNQIYRNNISSHDLRDSSVEAVDLIGRINDQNSKAGRPNSIRDSNGKNSNPELELSLTRPVDSEVKEAYESHILNHSSASAFSWYSTKNKSRTFDFSDGELPKVESVTFSSSWPKPPIAVPQSAPCDPSSPPHQIGLVPLSGQFNSGVWASYGNVFQPICTSHKGPTAQSPNSALQREESPFLTSPSLQSDPGTHSSNQGCDRAGDELKTAESVDQHGYSSSQVVDPSGSGTQCIEIGSSYKNIEHGSASEITEVNTSGSSMKGTNFVEDSEDCKPYIHDELRSTMGLHSAKREAALAKFREKRKGRCYEKKVRYQSRKRLAEQRPRVKGQFVRQVPCDRVLVDDKP